MSFVPYNHATLRQASRQPPRRGVAGLYAVFQRVAPADTMLADDDSLGEPPESWIFLSIADSIEPINRGTRFSSGACRELEYTGIYRMLWKIRLK